MSSHLSQSEKDGFHICLYFSSLSQLSFLIISCKMKGVLTYVCTWLSPSQLSCLPSFRKVERGGSNMCLFLAFPLSCHSTHRPVKTRWF